MSRLTNKQKGIIASLARKAWDTLSSTTRTRACEDIRANLGDPFLSDNQCFAHWRHARQRDAAGIESLRLATQDHFLKLRAHFHDLAGDTRAATEDLISADPEEEKRRRARHLLEKSCRQRELAYPSYPDAICRTQYRTPLADASANQLFRLLYTVRSRRKSVATAGNPQPHTPKAPDENPKSPIQNPK